MKIITHTSDELVLRPPIGLPIWIALTSIVVIFIFGVLLENQTPFWMKFLGIVFWTAVIVALVLVPHGLVTKCGFYKADNSLIIQRYALFHWGAEQHQLSDISSVEIYKQNERFYTVSLRTETGKIRLQGNLSDSSVRKLSQEIRNFLDVPETIAI